MSDPDITVTNNVAASRYEVSLGAGLAGFAAYRTTDDSVVFTHTEIDPAFEGQGLAGALASAALDDVRARGLYAVPICPYIKTYIRRHPEYADLVAPGEATP
jgi:predicted GNAT family acetyltransferase